MDREEFEEKRTFVHTMRDALKQDRASGVRDIELILDEERGMEKMIILFRGSHSVRINATHNSCGANAQEIVREVYGNGAFGRMKGSGL